MTDAPQQIYYWYFVFDFDDKTSYIDYNDIPLGTSGIWILERNENGEMLKPPRFRPHVLAAEKTKKKSDSDEALESRPDFQSFRNTLPSISIRDNRLYMSDKDYIAIYLTANNG